MPQMRITRKDVREGLRNMDPDEVADIAATTAYLWWTLESVQDGGDVAQVMAEHDPDLTLHDAQILLTQAAGAIEAAVIPTELN